MLNYLRFWADESKIPNPSSELIFKELYKQDFNFDTFWNSSTYTRNDKYLMLSILQYSDLINIRRNETLYNSIYTEVKNLFSSKNTHIQYKEFNNLISLYTTKLSVEIISHLWSIEFFKQLSNRNSSYILCVLNSSNTATPDTYTIPVLELVESIFAKIETQNKLLFILNYTQCLETFELTIKRRIYSILYKIVACNPKILTIKTTEFHDIITADAFLKIKVDKLRNHDNKAYTKLTLLTINNVFEENTHATFNLMFLDNKIISKGDCHIITSVYILLNANFIVQRRNKEYTKLSTTLPTNLELLANTKFFIDYTLISQVLAIATQEYKQIWQELTNLQKLCTNISIIELPTYLELKNYLAGLVNTKKIKEYKQQALQSKIMTDLKDLFNADTNNSIRTFLKINTSFEKLFKAWNYKNLELQESQDHLSELQKLYSRLSLLQSFFAYYTYLLKYNFEYCCFFIYLDFRGRVYYNSLASIQSYWCFRFLYYFNTDVQYPTNTYLIPQNLIKTFYNKLQHLSNFDTNLFEIFKSIGFLFKNNLTKGDGSIEISAIIAEGVSIYLKHRDTGVVDLYNIFDSDCKLVSELNYYIYAVNCAISGNSKNYYIWKDTTCSMAQHAGKLLGYNSQGLKYLNLDNELFAYDTYHIFIINLKQKLKETQPDIWTDTHLNYLNRKLLKNIIMTSEYGVSAYTAWIEYQEIIKTLYKNHSCFSFLNDYKRFFDIYSILKNGSLDTYFYKNNKQEWADNFLKKNIKKLTFMDLDLPIHYYNKINYPIYVEMGLKGGKRSRHVLNVPLSYTNNVALYEHTLITLKKPLVDTRKTKTALYVNAIHALDAFYLREITKKCKQNGLPLATIHDGFAVPYPCGSWIVSIANNCFNTQALASYNSLHTNEYNTTSTTIII